MIVSLLSTRELLDTVVEVGDEDVSTCIHCDADGLVELAVASARAAPLDKEGAVVRELLDVTAVI